MEQKDHRGHMNKMQGTIKAEDARALLQSTQQLRIHWSGVINTHIGYVITINVAIWSYFLKSYIDSSNPKHIVIAAAISAITLGLWRLYTHYIDNHIAGLYPDLLLYESILSVPPNHGTSGYLIRAVPEVKRILDSDLTTEQKIKGISKLVNSKRIGTRGHLVFDCLALILVILLGIAAGIAASSSQNCLLAIFFLIIMAFVFVLILIGLCFYQRKPSEKLIEEILSELKENEGSGA